jgi:hypothetical protein
MVRLMWRRNLDKGLKVIGDATAEDSGAKYFFAMLKYRCNPADPEAMALLQETNSGRRPLMAGGRTTTCSGCATSSSRISTTLRGGPGLMTAMTTIFRCCPSRIPTSAFGKRDRRYGPDTKEIIHYCSTECHIHHEFDLWTRSFRPVVEFTISRTYIGM